MTDSNTIVLFGLDPGETTGFVHIEIRDRDFVACNAQQWTVQQTLDWYVEMAKWESPATLIVEDYIIQPKVHGYSHEGDKGVALRLIGGAQLLCLLNPNLTFHLQSKIRKPAGYGFLGKKYERGKRGLHHIDALAHVMYYAVDRKLCDPIAQVIGTPAAAPKRSAPRIFRAQSHSQWRRPDKASESDSPDKSS